MGTQVIGGLLELFIIATASAAIVYYVTLGAVVAMGLLYRRIRYGRGQW